MGWRPWVLTGARIGRALESGKGEGWTKLLGRAKFIAAVPPSIAHADLRVARVTPTVPRTPRGLCDVGPRDGIDQETPVRPLQGLARRGRKPTRATDALRPRRGPVLERMHDGQREHRPRGGLGARGPFREGGPTSPRLAPVRMAREDLPRDVEGQGTRADSILLRDP